MDTGTDTGSDLTSSAETGSSAGSCRLMRPSYLSLAPLPGQVQYGGQGKTTRGVEWSDAWEVKRVNGYMI